MLPSADATPGESRLVLYGAEGKELASSPSALNDPRFLSEDFRFYRPDSDKLDVFISRSGRTIGVREDESSVFPHASFWIFQQGRDGEGWTSFPVDVPRVDLNLSATNPYSRSPLMIVHPYLEGISDTELYLTLNYLTMKDKHWRTPIAELEKKPTLGP